jgi:hypothetical protein
VVQTVRGLLCECRFHSHHAAFAVTLFRTNARMQQNASACKNFPHQNSASCANTLCPLHETHPHSSASPLDKRYSP